MNFKAAAWGHTAADALWSTELESHQLVTKGLGLDLPVPSSQALGQGAELSSLLPRAQSPGRQRPPADGSLGPGPSWSGGSHMGNEPVGGLSLTLPYQITKPLPKRTNPDRVSVWMYPESPRAAPVKTAEKGRSMVV